jgi:heme oxygenase
MVQINLMDTLKEAVRDRHARMEALPFIVALTNGELPLESYVGQLRAMAVIHGTLEYELGRLAPDTVRAVCQGRPSRLVTLRRDLSVFDGLLIPDIVEPQEIVQKIAAKIRRYRSEEPFALLGVLYVFEGTTLGNLKHLPDVLAIFGAQTGGVAAYYNGYGDKTFEYWEEFRCAMNALAIDSTGVERLVQVAHELFDLLEGLYAGLYPCRESSRKFLATMLNPEAGNHPVPDDAVEIQAAVTAARLCRDEFPYFNERYQERGRNFAKSDAAWLVTLSALPLPALLSQVEWLGRVLGNRGMPRITLERQLELLHEQLCAAAPEQSARYAGLLIAADRLREERYGRIPEPAFGRLAREFHIATDGEQMGRFKGTGALIVAAVTDRANGITDAVTNLIAWLTDRERFSIQWIMEVRNTLERAELTVAEN